MKYYALTIVLGKIWRILMVEEGAGTDCVAVKCVEIVGNTKGVGRHLVNL